MATFNICFLKPKGAPHLGVREGWREGTDTFIHSDTLFSGLCHSFGLLYGFNWLEKMLELCQSDSSPLRLSSAFYYIDDGKTRRCYFPLPRNQIPQSKEQKKIKFIEKEEWERLIDGKRISDDSLAYRLPEDRIGIEEVPGVNINRLTGTVKQEGGFFHTGLVWFRNAGLFFLYDVRPDLELNLKAALRLLCDEGIGGYRSVGKGHFEPPEFNQINIATPANADAEITLSLYYPRDAERADLAQGYYELLERKGYVYSPENRSFRRKTVTMFAEGSVFSGDNGKGMLVDVTPENVQLSHRVYRNGLAFFLPCCLKPKRGEL